MRLVCHNSISKVFDDDDNWLCINDDSVKNLSIAKKENPMFPLACCLKWDFIADDVEYLNELGKKNERNNVQKRRG